jgi:CubicO group peptidase (beta-lactamase class C family)
MSSVNALQHYFQALEAKDAFSGVVLITQGDVPLFAGAFGYASRTWRIRNSLDVRFDTASITKLFTAVATLQLVDQKRVALDTGVIGFLDLPGTDISRDVTVFHLLTHTSGIGDDADEEAGESYEALWTNRPNYSVTETVDFLPQFVHKPPNFPPGQGCRYCNCGYVLLGLVIERASGLSYRDYVRRNVFARAGLANSDFLRMDRVSDNVAEGCDPLRDESGHITGWRKNIYSYPPIGSPDGGAHVTAGDLDRFLRAVKAGVMLSPEMTTAFLTPQVDYRVVAGGTARYGYGLWFMVDAANHIVFYEKEGINAGASGTIRHYPKADLTVVILSNTEKGAWEPIRQIHEWVIGGQLAQDAHSC